jgi:cytochrome c oxidase assembly protein subunit 15
MMSQKFQRTLEYKPYLFAFCVFALCWITLLLFAGGFTTSINAGMAFLDWPLSNGSLNPEGWITDSDKLAEHSHRLLGMKIGLLSIGIFTWTYFREARPSVRTLARILLLVVVLQGVMGGARVRFDQLNLLTENNLLAQSFAVAHACGAQIVVGLLVTITLLSSRLWIDKKAGLHETVPSTVKTLGIITCAGIFLQILVGAIMRHAGAGLAIAKFPLANQHSLIPDYWNFGVSIHFAHRVGAIIVTVLILAFIIRVWTHRPTRKAIGYLGTIIIALLAVQIYLGALTIWTVKNPHVATAHLLVGAFLLATTLGLTLLAHRSVRHST